MSPTDWNWKLPVELQDVPWDCAAASLTWCLNTIGRKMSEEEVVKGLGPTRISPDLGLLDASGEGIVDYLAELGIAAENDADASWEDICAAAGHQPMLMGGRAWCHWTGVRIWGGLFSSSIEDYVALANPAPGWMAIHQLMPVSAFPALGPFSAVWFVGW